MVNSRNHNLKAAIEKLRDVGKNGYASKVGLCNLIEEYCIDSELVLFPIFREWPEYSGNDVYPIKGTNTKDPKQMYNNCKNMFSKKTKYGQARRRLALFVADELEKTLSTGGTK